MGGTVRILREGDVRAALDMASCIDAVDRAFAAYSTGRAELPGVIHLDVPETQGEVHVKAGYIHGAPYYAVKTASGFYGSEPAAIDGLIVVFDGRDGSAAAVLLDHGYVTDVRTGAAGGVAARHLAPERVETVAVIGTGLQARYQLDALAVVRPGYAHVRVWGRNHEHATHCVDDLLGRPGLPEGTRYAVAETVEGAVEGADVVITCTASRAPLVRPEWLRRGALVTALGSDGPEKQELDVGVVALADLVVVDSRDQCAQIGELHHALDAELVLSPDDVTELGEICAGARPGRTSRDQTILCDLTGVGVQDVAAANVVMERIGDGGQVLEI
ncbi:MAG TPA: ornithine cyclodeaminase family protein [Actinomycetota bacterium]|nr:ornithine cyclodeaminase family protein [Actinomycetota bacterium]